eukprot:Gb_03128 [translate_table: standard]
MPISKDLKPALNHYIKIQSHNVLDSPDKAYLHGCPNPNGRTGHLCTISVALQTNTKIPPENNRTEHPHQPLPSSLSWKRDENLHRRRSREAAAAAGKESVGPRDGTESTTKPFDAQRRVTLTKSHSSFSKYFYARLQGKHSLTAARFPDFGRPRSVLTWTHHPPRTLKVPNLPFGFKECAHCRHSMRHEVLPARQIACDCCESRTSLARTPYIRLDGTCKGLRLDSSVSRTEKSEFIRSLYSFLAYDCRCNAYFSLRCCGGANVGA